MEVAVLCMVIVGGMEFDSDERKLGGRLQEWSDLYVEKNIEELQGDLPQVFSPKPGRATVESMSIELEEGTKLHKLHSYRVPERLKAGGCGGWVCYSQQEPLGFTHCGCAYA